ncbi:TetR/AcrR family transcriptional regulator [Brucella pecoris]|uniref:TetR/AcrR family transcriptional regulator n=2 Tax=Brucella pecoris TaxID=867683 RepID=A0A5C5CSA2_9HYPH|nr:TetR/AcrR family transcriptional regulator [Brucella pecoris]TNV14369.1 TetR/AcrR family transcriptional regulator [Brucella pecoris]
MAEKGRPRRFDRETALRAAMFIFWEKGFDGSSLADLTTAMGINAPSLYAAFGSKEGLYLEALALYAGEVGIEIWSTLDETPDVREAFEKFLFATIDSYCQDSVPRGCMIALDALHRTHSSENVCAMLRNRRQSNIEILKKRLERSIREGDIAASVNCEAIATFYATVQNGMSILARDGGTRDDLTATALGAMAGWEKLVCPQGKSGNQP